MMMKYKTKNNTKRRRKKTNNNNNNNNNSTGIWWRGGISPSTFVLTIFTYSRIKLQFM
jgi:hypothetical protein